MSDHLIAPHGGSLVNLIVDEARAAELKAAAADWPSWDLTPRQICDIELLLNGAFSPLRSFLGQADYESVCSQMRLADGTIWPMPICLDLPEELANSVNGQSLALRDLEGVILAVLHVDEVYTPDREAEAQNVFGTTSTDHPGVAHLLNRTNPCYVSGRLEGMALPHHYDFRTLRQTPAELRDQFQKMGWTKIVAFQTRNPMHRAHQEITLRAAKEVGA
ncbi:MAG TPA: adenylyltransferase, partial [Acidimicrobiia bacterium]|nr:adenylyltransferase [Acidimicrobiia bacterium]